MPRPSRLATTLIAALALAVLGASLLAFGRQRDEARRDRAIGLFTSLPILWVESHDLAGMLATDAPPHWALAALRARGRVVALDTLAHDRGGSDLSGIGMLVMAQPRPLSPQENVALDGWVRGGGRLLLFADPMLTQPSAFSVGDSRRPQDIVMLSPILSHWGLTLEFDDAQPAGAKMAQVLGGTMPVALPGRFTASGKGGDCVPRDAGLAAICRIGRGRVVAIADAAVLEDVPAPSIPERGDVLVRLISTLESAN